MPAVLWELPQALTAGQLGRQGQAGAGSSPCIRTGDWSRGSKRLQECRRAVAWAVAKRPPRCPWHLAHWESCWTLRPGLLSCSAVAMSSLALGGASVLIRQLSPSGPRSPAVGHQPMSLARPHFTELSLHAQPERGPQHKEGERTLKAGGQLQLGWVGGWAPAPWVPLLEKHPTPGCRADWLRSLCSASQDR